MQSSSQRYGRVLFLAVLTVVLLLPIGLVEFPPLLDYPNHLAQAFVLTHLDDPNFHFSEFYGQEWHFYPYLTMNGFLIGMQHVIPLEWAGRIFLCVCLLAMPLCVWFFLRQANPGNDSLALWALLLSYNVFFLYGYLNFYLGVALSFLALGLWIQYLKRPGFLRWLIVLAAITGVYATHLFSFAVLGMVITVHLLWKRSPIRQFVFSWPLFLPGVLFYLKLPLGVAPTHEIFFDNFGNKMDWLTGFLRGYSPWVGWSTLAGLLACVLLAWWRNSEFRWNREWAITGGVLFILFWILPVGFGEAWDIYPRVLPFLFVMFLSFCHVGKRARWLALVALALFLVRMENITEHFLLQGSRLAGLAQSFDVIPKNARVLPIIDGARDGPVRRTYYHFWAYGAIRRGWLLPNLLSVPGMAALRLKSGVYRPDLSWDLDYSIPPEWNKVNDHYDYVWAYHVSGVWPDLQKIGRVIFQKEDLKLYRLNKSAPSTDQTSGLIR